MRYLFAAVVVLGGCRSDSPERAPQVGTPPAATPTFEITSARLGTVRAIDGARLPGPARQLHHEARGPEPPFALAVGARCVSGTQHLALDGLLQRPTPGALTIRVGAPLAALPQRCQLHIEARPAPGTGRAPRTLGTFCYTPAGTRSGPCDPAPAPPAADETRVGDVIRWPGYVAFTATGPARRLTVQAGPQAIHLKLRTTPAGHGRRYVVRVAEPPAPIVIRLAETASVLYP